MIKDMFRLTLHNGKPLLLDPAEITSVAEIEITEMIDNPDDPEADKVPVKRELSSILTKQGEKYDVTDDIDDIACYFLAAEPS